MVLSQQRKESFIHKTILKWGKGNECTEAVAYFWSIFCFRCYPKLLVHFRSQANYTDRATAACRRILRIEAVAWSEQRIPTAVNLCFLDRSCYFSIQVAPQLYSRRWMDPVPDPLLLRKSGSAGNRTRDLWICGQELWPLDHRSGSFMIKNFENFKGRILICYIAHDISNRLNYKGHIAVIRS
jgi:hypothetical protein